MVNHFHLTSSYTKCICSGQHDSTISKMTPSACPMQ